MNEINYQSFLEQLPVSQLIIDTNFKIVTASNLFLKNTNSKLADIVGNNILSLYLQNLHARESVHRIETSLNWVAKNKIKDSITIVKSGAATPDIDVEQIKNNYCRLIHSPVFDEANNLKYIIQVVEDGLENDLLTTDDLHIVESEERNKRYYQMLMDSPFAFCILMGRDLIITLANDLMKDIWGKGDNIEGKPLLEILPEMADQQFPELIRQVLKTGEPFYANEILAKLSYNGILHDKYFNLVFQPYHLADNSIGGVTGMAYEVTEMMVSRKKIIEGEQFSRSILQGSPDCIKVIDKDGRIEFMNDRGLCLLEMDDISEAKDKYWWDLWEEQDRPMIKDAVTKALAKKSVHFQASSNTVKGTNKWWDVIVLPLHFDQGNNTIEKLLTVSREITDYKKANLKIVESEHRYKQLIYSSPFLIAILKGNNFIIEIANDAIIEVWAKGSEIIGKSLLVGLPEIVEQGFGEILTNVFTTGESFNAEEMPVSLMRNGVLELLYFTFIFQAQKTPDGIIEGISVLGHEVTPSAIINKNLRISENHFRQLADMVPSKISNASADGNLIYMNEKWLEYTGKTFEEINGLGYDSIMHPDELEDFTTQFLYAKDTKTVFKMEMRFLNKYGEYKWHLNLVSPTLDDEGNIKMWIGSTTEIHDQVTQKQLLENAVKERTIELEIANKELLFQNEEKEKRSAELGIANTELAYQNSEKEKKSVELISLNKELHSFTYVASHDLQEPLRKIKLFAGRIVEAESDGLSETGKDYFARIQKSVSNMQQLIDDLLAFSRTSTADRLLVATNLQSLIDELKDELKESIEENNVTVEVSQMCSANIIAFQFRQLMQNLISNSIKFSKPGVAPHIFIESQLVNGKEINIDNIDPNKKYCHIAITDNGIGFEEAYSKRIFEVFQRLHGKEQYKGTGIGLAIVKKIVENHNGVITASSSLGNGACFNIYLPA